MDSGESVTGPFKDVRIVQYDSELGHVTSQIPEDTSSDQSPY